MVIADLLALLERLAPRHLAQPWDNTGLQVGDESAEVRSVLAALELTEAVLAEAVAVGADAVITHHPVLFSPVRSLIESHPKERLLRTLVGARVNLIACHTNLDAAAGGLADIAAHGLGLLDAAPLEAASAGWLKLVGFVPADAVDAVARATFAAGAGGIGDYSECAFAASGTGWFTPGAGSHPVVGEPSRPERTPEVRWETVVPKARLAAAVRAFVGAHPYEEPAFDIYPIEDVLPRVGLGRVGRLPEEMSLRALVGKVRMVYETPGVAWSGDGDMTVRRVAVLPGSGRSAVQSAIGLCEALVTGDLAYHDAEQATGGGLALVAVPHGELEWWAFTRWVDTLREELASDRVGVELAKEWRSAWRWNAEGRGEDGRAGG